MQRLVADLNLPVEIVACETLREGDGLAMSSRNARLSAKARAVAPALLAAMQQAAQSIRAGHAPEQALDAARQQVLAAGFERVEYIALRDPQSLLPADDPTRPLRMLAAAWLDGVRLIDNIAV